MSVDFETVDEFLEHFGIKGMHWGVRRQRLNSDGGRTGGRSRIGRSKTEEKPKKPILSKNQKYAKSVARRGATVGAGIGLHLLGVGGAPFVIGSLAVGIGARFVASQIIKNRQTKLNDIKDSSGIKEGASKANEILKDAGKTKYQP